MVMTGVGRTYRCLRRQPRPRRGSGVRCGPRRSHRPRASDRAVAQYLHRNPSPQRDRASLVAAHHPAFSYHTASVHAHDAADFDATRDEVEIRRNVSAGTVLIGECGLDYDLDHSPRERQRDVFACQLAHARAGSAVRRAHPRRRGGHGRHRARCGGGWCAGQCCTARPAASSSPRSGWQAAGLYRSTAP